LEEKVNNTWSTPLVAPLYPVFPIEYKNVKILSIVYRTDISAIQEDLPDGLQAISDCVMTHCYDMPDVQGMGQVNEANVMVGVKTVFNQNPVVGGFSTNLIISSDVGLTQGREVHGQPKKLGMVSVETRGDTVVAEIMRNDIRVFRATTPYKYQKSDISKLQEIFDFKRNINHKVIPNIDGSLAINQITSRTLQDVEIAEFWSGPVTVEISPHIQVPMYRYPVLDPLFACYWKADFKLKPGEILHDYLGVR
jgi:acetoacetate decarboxylase